MARLNVYVPDDLAEQARAAGVNISGIAQEAIRGVLAGLSTEAWLDALEQLPRTEVAHDRVLAAVDAARDELGA